MSKSCPKTCGVCKDPTASQKSAGSEIQTQKSTAKNLEILPNEDTTASTKATLGAETTLLHLAIESNKEMEKNSGSSVPERPTPPHKSIDSVTFQIGDSTQQIRNKFTQVLEENLKLKTELAQVKKDNEKMKLELLINKSQISSE